MKKARQEKKIKWWNKIFKFQILLSVEVETLFACGGQEPFAQNLLRVVLGQFEVMDARVDGRIAGKNKILYFSTVSSYQYG